MDPEARLLRLLSLLQTRPEWSASDLAERLGVTTRTLRRYVTRLRQLGYPVNVDPGRSGYMLGAGGPLPPLLLDDEEAFAVAHGLRLAAAAPVQGVESAALAALRKLDQMLPSQVKKRAAAIDAAPWSSDLASAPPVSVDSLILLAAASVANERVTFTYADFHDQITDRRVEPVRVVYVGQRWYLVGRDPDRDDWRTFRVDRMTDVTRTGHMFEPLDLSDPTRHVVEGIARTSRPVIARILVDVEPDDARRRYSRFATIQPHRDGRSLLVIHAESLAEIARSIISMSCTWQILEPGELRAAVIAHANSVRRMARA